MESVDKYMFIDEHCLNDKHYLKSSKRTCDAMPRKKLNKKERMLIYEKCNGHCAYCGCDLKFSEMQVDHIMPLRRNGADSIENMLPACRKCNHYKSTYTLEEFRELLDTLHGRMLQRNANYNTLVRFGIVSISTSPIQFYFEKIMRKD